MASHVRSIRFNPWLWETIEREATRNGISGAEFVRLVCAVGAALSAKRAGERTEFEDLLARALEPCAPSRGGHRVTPDA